MVQFNNGSTVVEPQLGTPSHPLDYEICDPAIGGQACDESLVFASAAELLAKLGDTAGCVIADLRMPGIDGLGLQEALDHFRVRSQDGAPGLERV